MRTVFEKLKRNAYGLMAFVFLGAAMAPAFLAAQPTSAAALMTSRSIKMSTSTPSATGATYEVNFTTATASPIQAVVVQFCAESPILLSATCTKPTGMTVGSTVVGTPTGLAGGTWTGAVASDILRVTNASAAASIPSGTNISLAISGFTNTSTLGTFYARIATYATPTDANGYSAGTLGTYVDAGGVALSTAQAVNISATVQETLTFCVSAVTPGDGCSGTTTPSLTLGAGTPKVLDPENVYTGTVYYQLSTNALGTTLVRIKSADAGLRSGSNFIDPIESATTTPVAMTAGKNSPFKSAFGIRTDSPITSGAGTITVQAPYNNTTTYGNNPTDITSTYGDEIASATGSLLNKNVPIVFGATASPTTPAGVYTGAFALIASSSY